MSSRCSRCTTSVRRLHRTPRMRAAFIHRKNVRHACMHDRAARMLAAGMCGMQACVAAAAQSSPRLFRLLACMHARVRMRAHVCCCCWRCVRVQVVNVRTPELHGYSALQMGAGYRKQKCLSRAQAGYFLSQVSHRPGRARSAHGAAACRAPAAACGDTGIAPRLDAHGRQPPCG